MLPASKAHCLKSDFIDKFYTTDASHKMINYFNGEVTLYFCVQTIMDSICEQIQLNHDFDCVAFQEFQRLATGHSCHFLLLLSLSNCQLGHNLILTCILLLILDKSQSLHS